MLITGSSGKMLPGLREKVRDITSTTGLKCHRMGMGRGYGLQERYKYDLKVIGQQLQCCHANHWWQIEDITWTVRYYIVTSTTGWNWHRQDRMEVVAGGKEGQL